MCQRHTDCIIVECRLHQSLTGRPRLRGCHGPYYKCVLTSLRHQWGPGVTWLPTNSPQIHVGRPGSPKPAWHRWLAALTRALVQTKHQGENPEYVWLWHLQPCNDCMLPVPKPAGSKFISSFSLHWTIVNDTYQNLSDTTKNVLRLITYY